MLGICYSPHSDKYNLKPSFPLILMALGDHIAPPQASSLIEKPTSAI
ncbi:hypothetical protein PLUTE_b6002 [Pseudoalteromonas luteoviolacea DSM 6061]|nr:hypothetical protein [Pseudoalteromonas luteoviolacea DSM 6061]